MTGPLRLSKRDAYKAGLNVLYFTGTHRLLAPFTRGLGAVLMLHRVVPDDGRAFRPNRFLEVTPEFLSDTIDYLRAQDYDIVSMDEVRERLANPQDRRFVAITFDDGFRDNYEIAYPILKRNDVPFTVYVATGLIDLTLDLWWVALERIIARQAEITIELRGRNRSFECAAIADKYRTYDALQHWLTMVADEDEQRQTIHALAEASDIDIASINAELAMTWNEVQALDRDPLATVGGHTDGHYALAKLDEDRARREMIAGVDRIEKMTGSRPRHFAYPYGGPIAAGPREFRIAGDLGFESAVTTRPGLIYPEHGDHITALPRVSLNGEFQSIRYLDLLMSGGPFALNNGFKRLNVA